MRAERFGAFDVSTRRRFSTVAAHVKRAIRIGARLASAQKTSIEDDVLLSHGKIAIFSISASGAILIGNTFGERLLKKSASLRTAICETGERARADDASAVYCPVIDNRFFDRDSQLHYQISVHRPSLAAMGSGNALHEGRSICMVRQIPVTISQKKSNLEIEIQSLKRRG